MLVQFPGNVGTRPDILALDQEMLALDQEILALDQEIQTNCKKHNQINNKNQGTNDKIKDNQSN